METKQILKLGLASGLALAGALSANISNASLLTFDLNCAKSTNGDSCDTFSPAQSWGHVTFSDNVADVGSDQKQILSTVDLNPLGSAGGQKVQEFLFNFLYPGGLPSNSVFNVLAVSPTILQSFSYTPDAITASPDKFGLFDVLIDPKNSDNSDPLKIMISLKDQTTNALYDLDPSMFNFSSVANGNQNTLLYDYVHIGNCGTPFTVSGTTYDCSSAGQNGSNSIKVGSTLPGQIPPNPDPDPIPEPTLVWMLGLGLLGLVGYKRKQAKLAA